MLAEHGLRLHRVVRVEEALTQLEAANRITPQEASRAREFLLQ